MYIFAHFSILAWLLIDVTHCKHLDLSDKNGFAEDADRNLHNVISMYHLDPLHKIEIEGQLPTLNYMLSEVYLYGIKDCMATQLVFDTEKKSFREELNCPAFSLKFKYMMNDIHFGPQVGDMEISTGKYTIAWVAGYRENKRLGKTYIDIGKPMISAKTNDDVTTAMDMDKKLEEEKVEKEGEKGGEKGEGEIDEGEIEEREKEEGEKEEGDDVIEPEDMNIFNGKDQDKARQFTNNIVESLFEQLYFKLKIYLSMTPTDQTLTKNKGGLKISMKKIMSRIENKIKA